MDAVLPLLATDDARWQAADDLPELELAQASVEQWVTITVSVDGIDARQAFGAFADGTQLSDWLGVPVAISGGRSSAQLEWGTKVRGNHEVIAPPALIALRWNFDDDAIPLPGQQLVGYLRFFDARTGCRVEVHQRAADTRQATFPSTAWSMVLDRFAEHAAQPPPGTGHHPRSNGPSTRIRGTVRIPMPARQRVPGAGRELGSVSSGGRDTGIGPSLNRRRPQRMRTCIKRRWRVSYHRRRDRRHSMSHVDGDDGGRGGHV